MLDYFFFFFRILKFLLLNGGTFLITGNSLVIQSLTYDIVLFLFTNIENSLIIISRFVRVILA